MEWVLYKLGELGQTDKDNTRWFHLHVESHKQKKQINRTDTDSEIQRTFWGFLGGRGIGGLGEKVRRLRSTNWQLENSQGHVKYGTGDMVNNIVLTMDGVRWIPGLWRGGGHFVSPNLGVVHLKLI